MGFWDWGIVRLKGIVGLGDFDGEFWIKEF